MTSPLHAPIAKLIDGLTPLALGARDNASSLCLTPFGHEIRYLDQAVEPRWVDLYYRSNRLAFGGPFPLPGWVLVDFFLLPGAITILSCKASELPSATRDALNLQPNEDAIAAAYCAVPCVEPGLVMGASLFSLLPHRGAASGVKALGLGMLRAKKLRGLAQWDNRSLRAHTRMGPLRVTGPAPNAHEAANRSFVYEVDLADHEAWAQELAGTGPKVPVVGIEVRDLGRLSTLAERAYHGERVVIAAPGLSRDGREVYVNDGSVFE